MRVAAILLAALIFAGAASARTVYIVDQSKLVHVSDLENALPAFQQAVTEDFAPYWGQDAQLVLTATPPAGEWTITIFDDSDLYGALGYHGFEAEQVYAKVFAKTSLAWGDTWQGTLTHELFELLADPYIDRMAFSTRLWLVEVADPVENDRYNYARTALDGSLVPISDFVTPAWYRRGARKPYDFARHVKHPFQVLWGGYASYWDMYGWHRVAG